MIAQLLFYTQKNKPLSFRTPRANVDFRLKTNMNINIRRFHEKTYISPKIYTVFKLTNLRLFMIGVGLFTILLSFFGNFSSPYLEAIGYERVITLLNYYSFYLEYFLVL